MREYWPHILTVTIMLAATAATAFHIMMRKDDTKAAVGWLGLVWFSPLFGIMFYWAFGINRIRRKARTLFAGRVPVELPEKGSAVVPSSLGDAVPGLPPHLLQLALLTEKITRQPLMAGNGITPLLNGDEAYPAMIDAIESAVQSVSLSTYIFDNDRWGKRFREALRKAVRRGVSVRVLVDSLGVRYSFPPVTWGLRRDGIPVAFFMRSVLPWRFRYFNLRTHRKILVVDGRTGFSGGMNIRAGNVLADCPRHPVQDIHFRIEGPVVAELQRAFADDWKFTTGESLRGDAWFPPLAAVGGAVARSISDGPDEDFDKLRLSLLGSVACARKSIRIITPYFLPDSDIVAGLKVAALRGVRVEILLPEKNNLPYVQWASMAGLAEILSSGCRVYLSQPPFDHSKIMMVDGGWSLIGSANWDPRSLLLNFEFNVECYDPQLALELNLVFEDKRASSRELTVGDLERKSLPARFRDRLFRLLSPYL